MNQEHGRRPEDGLAWKVVKDFWPIILAVVSIISMYSNLEGRVVGLEKQMNERGPVLSSHEVRITRVETLVIGLDKRLDNIETKIDRVYARVR
jgi:hypothetical protein